MLSWDDYIRARACVNACAGLDTEYLETVGLPEFAGKQLCADMVQQELDAVIAERDQLRAALESMLEMHGVTQKYADTHIDIPQSWVEVSDIGRAALAATEGV